MKFIKYTIYLVFWICISTSCLNKKSQISNKFVELNNQKILYQIRNSNNEKSCLLIHGFGDSKTSFEHLNTLFDSLGIKVIYYDLPGMGLNKEVSLSIEDNLLLIKKIYDIEGTKQSFAIGHSMGGLLLLLSTLEYQINFDKIITIEPSITKPDYQFFEYIQERPIGIGLDSFITMNRTLNGYALTYYDNLANSNISQLKYYAISVYQNFNSYTDLILNSNLKFSYVSGRLSSGLVERKNLGDYKNIDTVSFCNAKHWVHYDASSDFKKFIIKEFDKK